MPRSIKPCAGAGSLSQWKSLCHRLGRRRVPWQSDHCHPAVHMQRLTCHVSRFFTGKIQARSGNVFRLPKPLSRDAGQQLLTLSFWQNGSHRRFDKARRDTIYRDAARSNLRCKGLRIADHARLGSCIIRLARVAGHPDNRSNPDDPAPATFHHASQRGAGEAEGSRQVLVQYLLPILVLHSHGELITRETGIVNEDIERPQSLLYLSGQGRCRLRVFQAAGNNSAALTQFLRKRLKWLLPRAREGHLGPCLVQASGDGGSYAARSAGHERSFSAEVKHWRLLGAGYLGQRLASLSSESCSRSQ